MRLSRWRALREADHDREVTAIHRIAIVGASAAGIAAAETLRRNDYTGTITLIGAEAHLPYDRPPLSKQLLAGTWEPEKLALRTSEQLSGLDLDLRLGVAAIGLDHENTTVVMADGNDVGYDGLIIATGVSPRRLPESAALQGVHYLRTLDDALSMRQRMRPEARLLVVGAGFIGAEAAAVARGIGMAVTMVEPLPYPMARVLGPELGELFSNLHKDQGVDLRCGTGVSQLLSRNTEVCGAVLGTGEVIDADLVVVGIGTRPATEWLSGSALPLDGGVLAADQYCEVVPGVYAAGDVTSWYNPVFETRMRVEHRTNAAEQGRLAALNLISESKRPFESIPYFWSDQYNVKLTAWGHFDAKCEFAVIDGNLADRRFVGVYGRGGRVVGVVGMGMPKPFRMARSLIVDRAPFPG